ncbi:MAG: signal protein [Hamadaea sp.]|uniref:MHYT domain-containing protein n=1 Tax=Hamadaea sp. TaxID=2024425 RepID=UPI0017B16816|nr:MHYT domain-containing protein [Hamadaea sp.]NUR73075.1 signal protein [Hamadaea sp.]NUT18305.1 signal protein [Hamadaea sp.]
MAGLLSAEVHHFTYGPITPILAYAVSVLGSLLGLTCTARARRLDPGARRGGWLMLAAWAIGGTGIWTMHFMAMLGFGVAGAALRFDIPITVASAVLAVGVVGIGLFIVGLGKPSVVRVLLGGLFTGLGVASMHYTGMAALRVDGTISHSRNLVIASVVIAVVAATVALWFTLVVSKPGTTFASALVMGVAVCGMHYTAMAGVRVESTQPTLHLHGATAGTLLLPIIVLVVLVVVLLFYALLSEPKEEDAAARAFLDRQAADRLAAQQATAAAQPIGVRRTRLR